MQNIKIKTLYKEEIKKIQSFIDIPLSLKFYYKDRNLKKSNRRVTIVAGTIFSSIFFKSGVNYKDFDLYNKNQNLLWHSYSVAKYNMIVIGKSCIFGDKESGPTNHLTRNFWDNLLKKMVNPIDRFKFLLHHELGHLVLSQKKIIFKLNNLTQEENELIDKDIKECISSHKSLEKIMTEAYADCFAIYMLSYNKPDKIKPLTALVLNGRVNISHSNVSLNHFNRLDITPCLLNFSSNLPALHNLDSLHDSIVSSITYGLLKIIHLHSLQNKEYEMHSLKFVSNADREINQRKFDYFHQAYNTIHTKNGFLSLLQHELLSHYDMKEATVLGERHLIRLFQDLEAKDFIAAHSPEIDTFSLQDYEEQLQERQNNILVEKLAQFINAIYYFPRRGWKSTFHKKQGQIT